MNEYTCRLALGDGTVKVLRRTAVSREVLVRDLNTEGYLILDILTSADAPHTSSRRLSSRSVLKFTEVLTTLMSNGLPLKDSLILARNLGGKDLAGFLANLVDRVQKGDSLHAALKGGPSGFSPLYLGLVGIGEKTGDLSNIFPRLVDYLRARQTIRQKTVNALVYPVFVLGVALSGVGLLAAFVLPVLTDVIAEVNPEAATQYLANVEGFQTLSMAVFLTLALAIAGVFSLVLLRQRKPQLAIALDQAILKTPLWGNLVWQSFGLNVSFALEILLASGFSLEAALGECSPLLANKALRQRWDRVRDLVVQGASFSQALRVEGGFPETFLGWVEVGEAGHDLKRSFQQLRTFYQNQLDVLTVRFANLAEPALIVLVGVLVIVLVVTFITPIFTMMGRIYS